MELLETQEALQAAIQTRPMVIVQFGTESCAPCKALQHKIAIWNQSHPAVSHIYIPAADFPALCAQMGVFTVPAIFVYVDGRLSLQQSGYFSLEQLLKQVEKYQRMLEDAGLLHR